MAGRIPQDFIDSLLARSDIVELVDERVPLKKAGREYEACCPFHGEKTPSFKVSAAKQFYHCFGCGAHGTVLGFLMDYERLDFREAVELLAERVGMPIPDSGNVGTLATDLRPLYDILERAAAYFRAQLRNHPDSGRAVAYLKERGLTGEIAHHFGLGFAPSGWDNLHQHLGQDAGTVKLMKTAGLAVERTDGGSYDRFRNRIMFPIHDRRGRVIGFGGRVLDEETPKYLNSPETPVFHKGRELYGRWQAVRTGGRLERLIVVEGYMDVVALAQHGIVNTVASLGTAATPEHLETLFRLTPEVVFCFDGDAAGRRAAWRALQNTLPQMRDGRRAMFMFLPDGEDPDSLVRSRGAEAFRESVADATNLSDYLFEHLSEGLDLTSIEGKSRLHELGAPLLEQMPDSAFRALAMARLAELTGVDRRPAGGSFATRRSARPGSAAGNRRSGGAMHGGGGSLVRRAIALLIQHGEEAANIRDVAALHSLDRPGVDLLISLIDLLRQNPHLSSGAIVERYRGDPVGKHLASLVAQPLALEEGLHRELHDCIDRLVEAGIKARQAARLRELTTKGVLTEADKTELLELTRAKRADAC